MPFVNLTMNMNGTTHSVIDDYSYIPEWIRAIYISYLILIIVIGFPGNTIITIVYSRTAPKTACDWLILTMGITDTVVCLFSPLLYLRTEFHVDLPWIRGPLCQLEQWVQATAMIASCQILTIIAMDRYVKICKPGMRSLTANTARYVCLVSVISSGLVTTYPIVGLSDQQLCFIYQKINFPMIHKVYFVALFSGFFISFVVVTFAYTKVCQLIGEKIKLRQRLLDNKGLKSTDKNSEQEENKNGYKNEPNSETPQSYKAFWRLCLICSKWDRRRRKKFDLPHDVSPAKECEIFLAESTRDNEMKCDNDELQITTSDKELIHQESSTFVYENPQHVDIQTGDCKNLQKSTHSVNCSSNKYEVESSPNTELEYSDEQRNLWNRAGEMNCNNVSKAYLLKNIGQSLHPSQVPPVTSQMNENGNSFSQATCQRHQTRQLIIDSNINKLLQSSELHIPSNKHILETEIEINLQAQNFANTTATKAVVVANTDSLETWCETSQSHTSSKNKDISEISIKSNKVCDAAKIPSVHSEAPSRKIGKSSFMDPQKYSELCYPTCDSPKQRHIFNYCGCSETSRRDELKALFPRSNSSPNILTKNNSTSLCHNCTVSAFKEEELFQNTKIQVVKNNKTHYECYKCSAVNKDIPISKWLDKTPTQNFLRTPIGFDEKINVDLLCGRPSLYPLRRIKSETNITVRTTGKSNFPCVLWLDLGVGIRTRTPRVTSEQIASTASSPNCNASDPCQNPSHTIVVNRKMFSDKISVNNEVKDKENKMEGHRGLLSDGNQEKDNNSLLVVSSDKQSHSKSFPESNESNSNPTKLNSLHPPVPNPLKGSLKSPSSSLSMLRSEQVIKKTPSFANQLSTDIDLDDESYMEEDEVFHNKPSSPFLSKLKRSSDKTGSKNSKQSSKSTSSRKKFTKERQMTLMLVFVTATFLLSWIPTWAVTLTILFAPQVVVKSVWRGHLLLYLSKTHLLNFICNAIIYYRFNPTFRSKVKALLSTKDGFCCFCIKVVGLSRQSSTSETTDHI